MEGTAASSDHNATTQHNTAGMETVFSVDDFCNTDDLVMMIDASKSNEQQWYENDLQLAAELGKTLLERNKELEFTLRQQQAIVDDQALEIEYLSKQTTALREVGESRSKVYEQLEINLQELEKSHQKLQQDSVADKKKIKSLCNGVADLEQRCEQLQKLTDELSDLKKYSRRKTSIRPASHSAVSEESDYSSDNEDDKLEKLQQQLEELKCQMKQEQRLKEEMEVNLTSAVQENVQLREQIISLKQRLPLELKDYEDELKLCQRCGQKETHQGASDDTFETVAELVEVEDGDNLQSIGKCAVVKLNNGGTAYCNSESLQSTGETLSEDNTEMINGSLLSELDSQYRVLIEKYERMVNARQVAAENSEKHVGETLCPSPSCSEDFHGQGWRPTEESSSLSSGFSEADENLVHKAVQTEPAESLLTETLSSVRLNKSQSKQPFDSFFQRTPEYKTIFQEIFAVLKKSINYDEPSNTESFPVLSSSACKHNEASIGQAANRRSYADVLMESGARRRPWLVRKSWKNLNIS